MVVRAVTAAEWGAMSPVQDLATVENVPHGRTARRLDWLLLPPMVRTLIEGRLGSPVATAESAGSGFTPGFASLLTGRNGARLFVKAASKKAQRQFADAYRVEARNLRALPRDLPATRLLWAHEDDLWVILGFEAVDGGNPVRPWRLDQLHACLDVLEEVADRLAGVTVPLQLNPIHEDIPALVTGWEQLRTTYPDWPHLEEAAALAARFPTLPESTSFTHSDARDDNFLVARDGRVLLCDWNWPCLAPAWLDTVDLLVAAHGDGLDADALLGERRLTRDVDPDHVDAWLAAFCGFMLVSRDRPVPNSSPYLRVHARWYSEVTWSWLAARRGWS